MGVRRVFLLVVILAALGQISFGAESPATDGAAATTPAEALRSGYEALRDALYNSESVPRLEELHGRVLEALAAAPADFPQRKLWESRVENLIGRGYQVAGDKKKAAAHFERGLALSEEAQREAPCSEGWRWMSENIGQLCLVKDLGFLIANGLKTVRYAEKALALDPRNAAAQIIIASGKVYPPAVFGGNPRMGVELMQRALDMGTNERDDLFNIYSGIGLAYGKLKNPEEARRWLLKALELYPGNRYIQGEEAKLRM
jgi:tetratricopeptide (TPR) repeat protein